METGKAFVVLYKQSSTEKVFVVLSFQVVALMHILIQVLHPQPPNPVRYLVTLPLPFYTAHTASLFFTGRQEDIHIAEEPVQYFCQNYFRKSCTLKNMNKSYPVTELKEAKKIYEKPGLRWRLHTARQCCGSGIFKIPEPGSEFFHPGSEFLNL